MNHFIDFLEKSQTELAVACGLFFLVLIFLVLKRTFGGVSLCLVKTSDPAMSVHIPRSNLGKEIQHETPHFIDPSRLFQGADLNGFHKIEEKPEEPHSYTPPPNTTQCKSRGCDGVAHLENDALTTGAHGVYVCAKKGCGFRFLHRPPQDQAEQKKEN